MGDLFLPDEAKEGPCTSCQYKVSCKAYEALRPHLFDTLRFRNPPPLDDVDLALDKLIATYMASIDRLEAESKIDSSNREFYLSAIFDLAVTTINSNGLFDGNAEPTQEALASDRRTAFFPYTWMCPKRIAEGLPPNECYLPEPRREGTREYPRVEKLAKPGGRAIGDVGIKVLKSILRMLLVKSHPRAIMRNGGGLRSEFDLTITDSNLLIFIEVKAKPLVAYPLKFLFKSERDQDCMGWISLRRDDIAEVSLLLGATSTKIPLN